MPSLSNDFTNFEQDPERYVFRVRNDKQGNKEISSERKGVLTWLRAHTFWREEYKLPQVVDSLRAVLADKTNGLTSSLVEKINEKITLYNEKGHLLHVEPLKIGFSEKTLQEVKEFIQKAIEQHLEPYVTGKITTTSENLDRAPVMQWLMPKLQEHFGAATSLEEEAQGYAVRMYIDAAAKEFNRRLKETGKLSKDSLVNPSDEKFEEKFKKDFEVFVEAVQHAMSIDFKEVDFPENSIKGLLEIQLQELYAEAAVEVELLNKAVKLQLLKKQINMVKGVVGPELPSVPKAPPIEAKPSILTADDRSRVDKVVDLYAKCYETHIKTWFVLEEEGTMPLDLGPSYTILEICQGLISTEEKQGSLKSFVLDTYAKALATLYNTVFQEELKERNRDTAPPCLTPDSSDPWEKKQFDTFLIFFEAAVKQSFGELFAQEMSSRLRPSAREAFNTLV